MPNVQPFYNDTLAPALAGQRATFEHANVFSRILAAPSMAFGSVVVRGSADNECLPASPGNSLFLGIALIDPTLRAEENNQYTQMDSVAIMSEGVVWVVSFNSVTPGQAAYFDPNGNITNSATTANVIASAAAQGAASNVFYVAPGANVAVGDAVTGTDIAASSTVTAFNAVTGQVTLNNATTAALPANTNVTFTSSNTAIQDGEFDTTAAAGALVRLRLKV